MFRGVRFNMIFNAMCLWGAIPTAVTFPLTIIAATGGFDTIGAAVWSRHPHMAAKFVVVLAQAGVFFTGSVMGFWVGLTHEKTRSRTESADAHTE